MTLRHAAVNVLLAIERGKTTLAAEVDRARQQLIDERDRALLVELTSGTLRWRATLDALISQCSRQPVARLSPGVRATLRLAVYQLEHLDRVPAHAVLNEAVELTRTLRESSAAGFVNGVLRTLTRTRNRLSLPPRPGPAATADDQLTYLSTTLSHPKWLVERWLHRHGFEAAERWCQFNNTTPSAGMGEASRALADAVAPPPGARMLDVCAAPGGKTIVFAAHLQGHGLLVAADYRPSRVRLLSRTLEHAGLRVPIVALDATRALPFGPVFDRVFVDAPCSGLGVLRRDPDLKWSRQPDDLPDLAMIEHRILTRAADVVAPGGLLIYATCSSEPAENDGVVQQFLASDDRFASEPLHTGPMILETALIDEHGFFRTLPFRDGLDAFFAAGLRRVE